MFVTFEGVEGSGKSTIIRLVAERLAASGIASLITREPGDNSLGRKLRPILLDARNTGLSSLAELYLFLADRAQHIDEIIKPALEAGQIVLCDRFSDSTVVYQGNGRGFDSGQLEALNRLSSNNLQPDLTLLLDIPVALGLQRAGARNQMEGTVVLEGRFDSESLNFHERVRAGYLALANKYPERIKIVDAAEEPDIVAQACLEHILSRMKNNVGEEND